MSVAEYPSMNLLKIGSESSLPDQRNAQHKTPPKQCKYCGGQVEPADGGFFRCTVCKAFLKSVEDAARDRSRISRRGSTGAEILQALSLPFSGESLEKAFERLAGLIPNYRRRESQVNMAAQIMECVNHNGILLAEAGVGTGKTMAYLLPILESFRSMGRQGAIVISTRTNNLQEQLVNKDLPVVANYFKQYWHFDIPKVILSKGKRHYFCRERFASYRWTPEQEKIRQDLENWSIHTGTGDLSEKGAPYLSEEIREAVSVEFCTGDACPFYDECNYALMVENRRDKGNKIIVTNHNQYIQHLKLRSQGKTGLWRSEAAVVIDEAHALEAVARQELAHTLSFRAAHRYISYLRNFPDVMAVAHNSLLNQTQQRLRHLESLVLKSVAVVAHTDEPVQKYPVTLTSELVETAVILTEDLWRIVESIDIAITRVTSPRTERLLERLLQQGNELIEPLHYLRNLAIKNSELENLVAWVEIARRQDNRGRGSVTLVVAPLDVSNFLRDTLWNPRTFPVVLTSGTMRSDGNFTYIRTQLGIPSSAVEFVAEPLFNYKENVRIYIPADLPAPRPAEDEDDSAFTSALAVRVRELLLLSRGRALVLFTSYRRMNAVAEYLQQKPIPYQVLVQGQASQSELLSAFRSDTHSVLLATGAFWEGVDVAGEALSLVIMDKLPFPVPSDPLIHGLCSRVRYRGGNEWDEVLLPIMLTTLQQGAGRLVRQEGDKGVIALLDVRALEKRYWPLVRKHLPPAPVIHQLEEVGQWYSFLEPKNR